MNTNQLTIGDIVKLPYVDAFRIVKIIRTPTNYIRVMGVRGENEVPMQTNLNLSGSVTVWS